MKKKSSNELYLLFSITLSGLITACASNAPAPTQSTIVTGSQSAQNQASTSRSNQSKPNTSEPSSQNSYGSFASYDGYICEDAPVYIGKSIGDGECVDLIKLCSNAPLTRYWKPGKYVFGKDIPAGTAIATFRRGKYPNRTGYHAAIYSHQDKGGIYAWDQWRGQPVHLRYIKARQKHKDAGNNASKYRVIKR